MRIQAPHGGNVHRDKAGLCMKEHGIEMLRLGATRVEIGIQSVYDNVLSAIERGHSVKDSIEAIRIMKDLGFKVNAHVMLACQAQRWKWTGMPQGALLKPGFQAGHAEDIPMHRS